MDSCGGVRDVDVPDSSGDLRAALTDLRRRAHGIIETWRTSGPDETFLKIRGNARDFRIFGIFAGECLRSFSEIERGCGITCALGLAIDLP